MEPEWSQVLQGELHRLAARVGVRHRDGGAIALVLGPVEGAALEGRGAEHRRTDRAADVETAASGLAYVAGHRALRGGDQRRLDLLGGPLRVALLDHGGGTGDVRGRHRRTGHGPVRLGAASPGGCGRDGDAGCGDLGLEGARADRGAPAGEVRRGVVAVDRAHREDAGCTAGRGDGVQGASEVSGGDHEQGVLAPAQLLRGQARSAPICFVDLSRVA